MSAVYLDSQHVGAYAEGRFVVPILLDELVVQASGKPRILDLGCGTGHYAAAIAGLTGTPVWGVDPSSMMLREARVQTPACHFAEMAGEHLALASGAFNLCYMVDMVHHASNLDAMLSEVGRVLAPGGTVCVATLSHEALEHWEPCARYFPSSVRLNQARFPALARLYSGLESVGFHSLDVKTLPHRDHVRDVEVFANRGYSILHLIPGSEFEAGMRAMRADAEQGPILDEFDYSLITARKGPN
jgi:ubiquinone/menaquinone biosynthesis C-methylase UbiE